MTVELCDNCENEIIGYAITTYAGNRLCGRGCVVEFEAEIARRLHDEQAATELGVSL